MLLRIEELLDSEILGSLNEGARDHFGFSSILDCYYEEFFLFVWVFVVCVCVSLDYTY